MTRPPTEQELRQRECTHCGGQLQGYPARDGKPASWRCNWCSRWGRYATAVSTSGIKRTARIEHEPGKPELAKPWVSAESVPYEERVAC